MSVDVIPNLSLKCNIPDVIKKPSSVDTLSLITISRITPIKNIIFLLQVLKRLEFKVVLNLIGPIEDKGYWQKCKNIIGSLPDNCKVVCLNEISPDQIRGCFLKSDLFISASLNENYGHSIVEALSEGCPVIISDQTPWKQLEESKAGAELELEIDLFVDKLNYFKNLSNEEWVEHRVGALDYFKKNIDLDIFRDKYFQMFNSLANKNIR